MNPPPGRTAGFDILRVQESESSRCEDLVAAEEPLEIRINDKPVSITMRTPGDDFDLAAGFLFTEGILRSAGDIASIRHWGSPNVVRVALRDGLRLDVSRLQRNFYSTSSCGVCGKTSIDALRVDTSPIESTLRVTAAVIHALPSLLRREQNAFDRTGGMHAAAIATGGGELMRVREDVGRHNAVDKVIGSFVREQTAKLDAHILFVSSRAGFEIVQKAIVAGVPIIATVGAPTSLAIELARDRGATLIGFVRDTRFNIYCGEQRLVL